jgi:hypothetical protein
VTPTASTISGSTPSSCLRLASPPLAYDLARLAVLYASDQAGLQQQINTAEAFGKNASVAQSYVTLLGERAALLWNESAGALALLGGASVAGFPGNRPSLITTRGYVAAGQAYGSQASTYLARAHATMP